MFVDMFHTKNRPAGWKVSLGEWDRVQNGDITVPE